MEKALQSKSKRYRIIIPLSQTKLLSYDSGIAQDKIFFLKQDNSHLFLLHANEIIDTGIRHGMLIKIYQN